MMVELFSSLLLLLIFFIVSLVFFWMFGVMDFSGLVRFSEMFILIFLVVVVFVMVI